MNLSKHYEIFKIAAILRSGWAFKPKVVTESWVLHHWDSHANIPTFWAFDRSSSSKIDELWQFKNLTYFRTWWRHRWRHQHQKLYRPSQIRDTYMCQVWCWLLERATCSVTITDKQTNRQTDKQTSDEHTCQNWKFWQVINRRQKMNKWGLK